MEPNEGTFVLHSENTKVKNLTVFCCKQHVQLIVMDGITYY